MEIRLEHVAVTYGKGKEQDQALQDVSCAFESGKINWLCGASGAGKSTLLRYIARLIPGEGHLWFDDENMDHALPQNLHLAYVNQETDLYPNLTVFDNLAFPLKHGHYDRDEVVRQVTKMAEVLSLSPCLGVLPRYLSLGQQQLVMLGKAFLREADPLLLDEPFSHLDSETRSFVFQKCLALQKVQKNTLILVSHEENEIMPYFDHFVWLERGRVLAEGNHAQYQSSFLRLQSQIGGRI
jgi:ABC-type sugar transport system ATPase subunit